MSKISLPFRFVSKKVLTKIPKFITPNLIVYFGFVLFLFFPIILFYDLKIISIVLLIFVVFLDHLDGDLARYRNETSSYGAKIDMISDRLRGLIMALSIGFILMKSNDFMPFIPLVLFITNEFVISYLRPKKENYNFIIRLVYNLDILGWVSFSYIYPFIILLPVKYLYNFYIIATLYVFLKFLITLYFRLINFNRL